MVWMIEMENIQKEKKQKSFIVEREFRGKYSVEEFLKRVIKSHMINTICSENENDILKKG